MKTPSFEIKVALLGNVSAGKTTVLNALLRDKYGEVAMKRTTASVNYFIVHGQKNKTRLNTDTQVPTSIDQSNTNNNRNEIINHQPSPAVNHPRWSNFAENPRSAEETLKEITLDNQTKLSQSGGAVKEKWFEIELEEEIIEMRPDTKLILVDIPGLNEAGVFDLYKKWVQDHWHTFDCAIVVMDGKSGVNTEDQVFLLKLANDHCQKIKSIPIIILFNKVDEPEDEQQAELVKEARTEIEKIFGVGSRELMLNRVLERVRKRKEEILFGCVPSPMFIPVSAVMAYIQLSASRMTLDQFRKFDADFIHRLGRDYIGRIRWNKLTDEEKVREAYKVVTDHEDCQEVFRSSNFETFLDVLEYYIGGSENQIKLFEKQLDVSIKLARSVNCDNDSLCQDLRKIFEQFSQLQGESAKNMSILLSQIFWKRFLQNKSKVFQHFHKFWPDSMCVRRLAKPMQDLVNYYELASFAEWQEEKELSIMNMKKFVNEYFVFLLNSHADDMASDPNDILNPHYKTEGSLNPFEWSLIFESVLLASKNKYFTRSFSSLEILLRSRANYQDWLQKNFVYMSRCQSCHGCLEMNLDSKSNEYVAMCPKCRKEYPKAKKPSLCLHLAVGHDGEPRYQNQYCLSAANIMRFTLVTNISNPDHFGHLPWLFCKFKTSIESPNNH